MNQVEAEALVTATLGDLWNDGHEPVLGAKLKLEVLRRSHAAGGDFDERRLGFANFAGFLDSVPDIVVQRRPGTDFLVAPQSHAEELVSASPRARVRPDFWRAFVGFPVVGEVRAYSPSEDRVLAAREGAPLPIDAVPITPIARDKQLQWRVEFARSLAPANQLSGMADSLTLEGGFARFARALDGAPELRPAWNAAWFNHVTAEIRSWGEQHGIADTVWLTTETAHRVGRSEDLRRRELLDIIGRIPTEYLEQIEIKLSWLVGSGRRRD